MLDATAHVLLVNPGPRPRGARRDRSATCANSRLTHRVVAAAAGTHRSRASSWRCARCDLRSPALEAAVAAKNLERVYRANAGCRVSTGRHARHASASRATRSCWRSMPSHSQPPCGAVPRKLATRMLAASQLDTSGKLFKKTYSARAARARARVRQDDALQVDSRPRRRRQRPGRARPQAGVADEPAVACPTRCRSSRSSSTW